MRLSRHSAFAAAVVLVAMLACNLPLPPGNPTSPEPDTPIETPDVPTLPPVPTETVVPSATPVPEPAVVTFTEGAFNIYSLDGSLLETRPAPGLQWVRPGKVQILGRAIYYVDSGGEGLGGVVKRLTDTGAEEIGYTSMPA